MNEREFLQALSELPPTFVPNSSGALLLRYVRGEGRWCPVTAVAAMRGMYDKRSVDSHWGSMGYVEAAQFLQLDPDVRDRIVRIADGKKKWWQYTVLTWKMRRIYNRQRRGAL